MIRARRVLLLIILFLAAGVLPVFSLYQADIRYSGAGEVIPVGSRVYDLFDDLFLLCGHTTPSTSRPWTVSEARSELSKINISALSSHARKLYDEISAIICADKDHDLFVEFSLSPEVYVHSNSDFCLEEYLREVNAVHVRHIDSLMCTKAVGTMKPKCLLCRCHRKRAGYDA